DPDEAHLGDVEPLSEEVDPDEDVELAQPEFADDLGPLDRLDLGVEVAGADPVLREKIGQLFCELLRQGRHQGAIPNGDDPFYLKHHVPDLPLDGPDLDLGVQEPRRPDDLLDYLA